MGGMRIIDRVSAPLDSARSVGRLARGLEGLARALDDLVEAWLPVSCIVCGVAHRNGLCPACEEALPGRHAIRCPCCGLRMAACAAPGSCTQCATTPPAFERTIVLADYAPPLDRIVHALKFGRDAALAQPLGRCLARLAQSHRDCVDGNPIVAAVPLSVQRLAWRGFNQSLELARAMAGACRFELGRHLLRRTRAGAPSSTLHARERHASLADAFNGHVEAAGRSVLLVDDVMTTGATMEAAAAALRRAGAARVINCVLARTPRPDAERRPGSS